MNHPTMDFSRPIESHPEVEDLIRRALAEDLGAGDITTEALVPPDRMARARLITRQACRTAGLGLALRVFQILDPRCRAIQRTQDGRESAPNTVLLELEGPAGILLTAERTALNFAQRMTGIATLTHRFVDAVKPFPTIILDTRKTTPTLRILEKYAVHCGGGVNHRMGLFDMILIKDNHRLLWSGATGVSLAAAVNRARSVHPGVPIEIEVETLAELRDALEGRPDWVLLDNMTLDLMRECVARCRGRCRTEASGGLTLDRAAAVAATGVDALSIGALTHSAPAADLSLDIEC